MPNGNLVLVNFFGVLDPLRNLCILCNLCIVEEFM